MNSTFEELISSETPVLIDFHATWCGPCKAMAPALQKLADQLGDDIRIVKIDIDQNRKLSNKYKVNSVPTIMIFKKGRQLFRNSGSMMFSQLMTAVKPHL